MIALSGVRSSCDMLARNSDLCWLAISSCRLLSWISRNRRAFWIAITAWSAKVLQQRDLACRRTAARSSRPRDRADAVCPSQSIGATMTVLMPSGCDAVLRAIGGTSFREHVG